MKKIVDRFILGLPARKRKARGKKTTPKEWQRAIIEATRDDKKITKECLIEVDFFFRKDQYPTDLPYGPDLDNYLKSLFDALGHTVFSEVAGKDSAITKLIASKKKATGKQKIGAKIVISQ